MQSKAAILSLLSLAMLVGCGGAHRGGAEASAAHVGRIIVPSSDAWALPPGHPPVLPEGHPPVSGLPEGHPPISRLPEGHPPVTPRPEGESGCPGSDRPTKPIFEFGPGDAGNEIIST